jgi:hypothetical protein
VADFDFKFDIRKGYVSSAQRRAALYPICAAMGGVSSDLVANYQAAQKRWRVRVEQMASVGFGPFQTDISHQFARNCPPFGIRKPSAVRSCRLRRLCPWCFGREVVGELYRAMEYALYRGRSRPVLACNIWVVTRTFHPKGHSLSAVAKDMGETRRNELDSRTFGSAVYMALEQAENGLCVTRTTVGLFLDGHLPGGSDGVPWTPGAVTKKNLSLTAQKVKYPLGMLFSDPSSTKDALSAFQAAKLSTLAFTGMLRNRTNRRKAVAAKKP